MLALKIPKEENGIFMGKLLREDIFDIFEIRHVQINSFVSFEIDGLGDKDYISQEDEEKEENFYYKWDYIKPYVFNIVKGKIQPKSMKFIFSLPKDNMEEISENASALFLNILFEKGEAFITTGASTKVFSLDKSLDVVWDNYVNDFLIKNGINAIGY